MNTEIILAIAVLLIVALSGAVGYKAGSDNKIAKYEMQTNKLNKELKVLKSQKEIESLTGKKEINNLKKQMVAQENFLVNELNKALEENEKFNDYYNTQIDPTALDFIYGELPAIPADSLRM